MVLRTLYRVFFNSTDRTTSFGPDERGVYPLEAQLYYVPEGPATELTELDRMVNSSSADHADAVGSLNGYAVDDVLGYPWSAASLPGLAQMAEGFSSATGDHAMLFPSENLSGYASQPLPVYGYPRYGSVDEVLLSLTAGGVQVQSNAVAGGATWRWSWNGVQFLNNRDYGRQIQAAFYYPPTSGAYNPNEAGDGYSRDNPVFAHGSPLVRFENVGTTQFTRAVPLNWNPAAFGGDLDHPVIWSQIVLGKDLTLNFNNMGSVAKYTTHVVLPTSTMGGMEAPAIYLRATFNRFWTYDATSKTLQEVSNQVPSGCNGGPGYVFHPSFGGTIASDSSGNYAMGVYVVDEMHGGSVNFISIGNFICSGDGTDEASNDTVVMDPIRGGSNSLTQNIMFPAGESTFNVYIITDTVQNVAAQMNSLYSMGAK
jgi:hypothetical protein